MKIPIPTLHLFGPLDRHLLELLRTLAPEDWSKPTLAKLWTVKDVAAHLLDGNLRSISLLRDRHENLPDKPIQSHQHLVDYLNQLNADWVKAMKRISPAVLIELLETTGKAYQDCLSALDPFMPSVFSVSWAGESESLNWFHIAREYTEKWHHQKQIREAVGTGGLMEKEFFQPVIQTFMKALPHTYRNTQAAEGNAIEVTVTTEAGGTWAIKYSKGRWEFSEQCELIETRIKIDPDIAWKLFTKGISPLQASDKLIVSGKEQLAQPFLKMVSIVG